MVDHHRRRLARLGNRALAAPAGGWAEGAPPPRTGNAVDVLVDGAEALAAIAEAIESARESVWLAGWFFSPGFRLRTTIRARCATLLAELVAAGRRARARLGRRAAAALHARPPATSPRCATRFTRGSRVAVALDARERPMHCHHEKLVVVDGEVAFVGGIDLTSLAGDRLDSSEHPNRGSLGWHDAAARVRGPGGRGRRRPLPPPLAGGDGRAAPRRAAAPPAGRRRAAARPHRAGADLRAAAARRVLDPRELPARAPPRRAPDLPREPVPLVARARRGARRQAPASRRTTASGSRAAAGEAEQRPR